MNTDSSDPDDPQALRSKKALARWTLWHSYGQTIVTVVGLGYLVTVALGVFLSFFYLARHSFSPGGISADDAISFVYLFFAFLVVLLGAYFLAFMAGFPFMRLVLGPVINVFARTIYLFKNRNGSAGSSPFEAPVAWRQGLWQWGWLAMGVVPLAAYIALFFERYRETLLLSTPIFTTGVFISYVVFGKLPVPDASTVGTGSHSRIDVWMRQRPEWIQKAILCFSLLGAATIFCFAIFLDSSWRVLGIRKENVAVRLSEENFARAVAFASRNGMIVNPCEQIGSDTILRGVDIPWHKFGTDALVIFPALKDATETRERPKLRLEPESDDIDVIEETDSVSCEEVATDWLYSAGSSALTRNGSASVTQHFAWMRDADKHLRVKVVVHRGKTDKPLVEAGKSLTQRQAESMKTILQSAYGLPAMAIEAVGEEDAVPKRECDDELSTMERRACERMNRRIEVFIAREP
ncbi:hypothetical protein [Massilia sp. CCM 8734]|uniref:hypothetical protein n=1 Tax=Massilia sp. CCM 8734 TaxID=2609283 RepID=UPI00141EA86F|nr:hypothetical protein [Massilia sp. CCM 8734]NHZ97775.1 hypothetical protein [Massilia sp. CCM 8734]